MELLAISPDPPEVSAALKQELNLRATLLSDTDRRVPPLCGLSHCVVLLDRHGVVRWGALDENWRSLNPDSVIQAAYRLGASDP